MNPVEVESDVFLSTARRHKTEKGDYQVLEFISSDANEFAYDSCKVRHAVSEIANDYRFAMNSRVGQRFFSSQQPEHQCDFLDINNTLSRRLLAKKKFDLIVLDDQPEQPGIWAELLTDRGVLLFEKSNKWYQYQFELAQRIDTFPLTDIQYAYWIGRSQNLALGGVSCHVYFEWQIEDFDLARFENAWNRLVARHDMMRACVNDNAEQYILPQVPTYQIPVANLIALPDTEKEKHRLQTRQQMCDQVLDAQTWPLFDLRASQMKASSYCIHLDLDLLVFDVQSFHIILSELARLYDDPEATLPEINYSFRDYLLLEKSDKSSMAYRTDKQWWLDQLASLPAAPKLPLAVQPSDLPQPEFIRLQGRLSPSKWQALSRLASEMGVTTSVVLLVAFSEVLARWSEQANFTLNLTQFNRRPHHPDVDKMVGDFTSVLLVSVDLRESDSFQARALKLQQVLRERLAHSRFGGVEVMRELAKQQGVADSSLMPIVFTSLLGMDLEDLVRGAGLLGEPNYLYTATPQVWFDHQVMVRKGTLEYNWIVIENLFPEGMIDGMFEVYGTLLDTLSEHREAWLAPVQVPLPVTDQARRLAVNQTEQSMALQPLHMGFFQQALKTPDAVAVISQNQPWSYKKLADEALNVAQILSDQGAKKRPVAVYLPKGADQIIAALAVMAAGAILIPCGYDWPIDRVNSVLEQADACALISENPEHALSCAVPVLNVQQLERTKVEPFTPVIPELSELAYIIYTSGSTGAPKGVAIAHGAAANTLADVSERLNLCADDRVFGLSSLSFDLAIFDVFATLACGAALVLPEQNATKDAARWLHLVQAHQITIWNSVPALMEMLVAQALSDQVSLSSLRAVLLSGDWFHWALAEKIPQVANQARVIAMGGATEAAIWSNWFEVNDISDRWAAVPYGFPLANQRYFILDAHWQDCPAGVVGDLYIGGLGLAHSYWNDPERTSQSFVTHPVSAERLYRTGDLARYDRHGCIEFLGRQDAQIKLGGHRIELGEIESVLQSHPGVQSAVVDLTGTGSQQLSAWLVLKNQPADSAAMAGLSQVGDQAAKQLPAEEKVVALAEFQQHSEALAPYLVMQMLLSLQFANTDSSTWNIKQKQQQLGLDARFSRLINTWHEMLLAQHWLTVEDQQWQLTDQAPTADVLQAQILEHKQTLAKHLHWLDDGESFLNWLFANTDAICKVLYEPRLASSLLFPEGDSNASEALYQRNIVADYLGGIAANLLPALLRDLPQAKVFEIGAGIGGLTASTLPAFARCCPEGHYIHTDVSPWFSTYAQQQFGEYSQLQTGRYDINQPLAEQAFSPASFDLVMAANVLHNAHHLPQTLSDIYRLLKPGGACIVLEATKDKLLQWVSAAAVLEHAGHSDNDSDNDSHREPSPLLSEQQWHRAFRSAGFEWVGIWPIEGKPMAFAGQQVFLVRRPRQQSDLSDVQSHAAAKLPEYMLPKQWMDIPTLPLNSNGKIDRKQLPHLERDSHVPAEDFVALQSATEVKLGAIWCDLLGLEQVSATHDFFAMGGDSLLATRLVTRISEEFGQKISIRLIFTHSELRQMASELDAQPAQQKGSWQYPLIALDASTPENAQQKPRLLCLHASDGFAMPYHSLAAALPENISCIGLQASGLISGERPISNMEEQGRRAVNALRNHGAFENCHLLGWSMGSYLAIEIAHQLKLMGEQVASLILIDPPSQAAMSHFVGDDYQLWQSMASPALKQTIPSFTPLSDNEIHHAWRAVLPAAKTVTDDELYHWIQVVQANVRAMVEAPARKIEEIPVKVISSERRPEEWGDCAQLFDGQLPANRLYSDISGSEHFTILDLNLLHTEVSDFLLTNTKELS